MLEWKRQLDVINRFSNPKLANVCQTLALSFHDLPYHLKLCFLSFSIFPKDSQIPSDKLFKLWITEGFIQEQRGLTLEEIAEEYLNELVHRNLVEVCEGFHGLEKFFRVHDLIHEIALQKAKEFNFFQIEEYNKSRFQRKICRLSICNGVQNVLESIDDSHLHSVFFFNIGALNNFFLVTLFERYKLLTLLDLENVPIELLPEELGNLLHLKYLNLQNTKLRWLPKSVGKLYNLQTLDLRNTLLFELPTEINELRNLHHLLASGYENKISLESTQGVIVKYGIRCSENLQTLMTVEAHLTEIGLVNELKKLTKLRSLGISRLTEDVATALCACIKEMSHLECLSLDSTDNHESLDLQKISSPSHFLKRLVLKGIVQNLPHWIPSLQTKHVVLKFL